MSLDEALKEDILTVLPFGGDFLSVEVVTRAVAPLRAKQVRAVLNAMAKTGALDLNPAGGGHIALYGRKELRRL